MCVGVGLFLRERESARGLELELNSKQYNKILEKHRTFLILIFNFKKSKPKNNQECIINYSSLKIL